MGLKDGSRTEDEAIAALRLLASRPTPWLAVRPLDWMDRKTPTFNSLAPLVSWAAGSGCERALRALLAMGADPETPDSAGNRPLWHAIAAAKDALASGASGANPSGSRASLRLSPLDLADRATACAKALFDAGADPRAQGSDNSLSQPWTFFGAFFGPLVRAAACSGHWPMVEAFLAAGAPLLDGASDGESLLGSVARGDESISPIFEKLVDAGAPLDELNADGDTPLIVATRRLNKAAIRELLRLGANESATSAKA